MQTFLTIASTAGWIATSYLAADFATGVVHWIEDTWMAPGRSKLLDRYIVLDNLEHHRRPGTIRGGSYWATNGPSVTIAASLAAIFALFGIDAWQLYLMLAFASQGNQVHKWSHSSDRPAIVAWLQTTGIVQSRAHHGKHHSHPFAVRYCALTNVLNPVLDATGFWRGLERAVELLGATVQRGTPARNGL